MQKYKLIFRNVVKWLTLREQLSHEKELIKANLHFALISKNRYLKYKYLDSAINARRRIKLLRQELKELNVFAVK